MKRFFALSLFFICLYGTGLNLLASSEPALDLKSAIEDSLSAVYDPSNSGDSDLEKQQAVRKILESRYDLTVLIRRAMGRNWDLLKGSEQDQVVELITQLVVKAYVKNLGGAARPEISYGKTVEISDKRIEIPSTIKANGKTYYVTYRLGRLESGWQIYDIVAENISVVSNYRQQLDDHFQRGSGAELIKKLENLLKSEDLSNEIKI